MGAREIYRQLTAAGLTAEGACAMLGNMQAESGMQANIAQRGMTSLSDAEYTRRADCGELDFAKDAVGYGLCQWTYWSRKSALLDFARARGVSVGDERMQTEFCIAELRQDYAGLWAFLRSSHDLAAATERICREYERPAVNNVGVRLGYAQHFFALATAEGWEAGAADSGERGGEETYWPPRMLDYKAGRANLHGADVLVLQALLCARGYDCPTSGDFDGETRLAVMAMQAESGLVGDGIAGNATWTRLLERR